jgi:hypothetical protein
MRCVIGLADQPERQLSTEAISNAIYDVEVPLTRSAKHRGRRWRRRVQGLERRGASRR